VVVSISRFLLTGCTLKQTTCTPSMTMLLLMFFVFSGPFGDFMFCMLLTFENRGPLMRQGISMEWYFSFPFLNSLYKTEAAIFTKQTMLPKDFPFLRLFVKLHTCVI